MRATHYKVKNKGRFALMISAAAVLLIGAAVGVYLLFFAKHELSLSSESYDFSNLDTPRILAQYTGKETLVYQSSDESVFTVDQSGNITVVNGGTATVTVSDVKHDVHASATINCTVYMTGLSIGEDITLTEGDSTSLKPVVTPDNVTDGTIAYTTSDDKIATVDDDGKIKAVKAGTATVTAQNAASGVSASVKITVKAKPVVTTPSGSGSSSSGNGVKEATYINGILIANKTYALPSTYAPGGLTKETQAAYNQMKADAAKEGLKLTIVSGYRSYDYQMGLYNRYVKRDGKAAADTYSARPGHSEHQTGLAMDICSLEQSFENTAEGKWLAANAHKYGFILRYPKGKQHITGYIYEPWHFRYLGVDTATAVYNSGLCLEEYLGITSKYAD